MCGEGESKRGKKERRAKERRRREKGEIRTPTYHGMNTCWGCSYSIAITRKQEKTTHTACVTCVTS